MVLKFVQKKLTDAKRSHYVYGLLSSIVILNLANVKSSKKVTIWRDLSGQDSTNFVFAKEICFSFTNSCYLHTIKRYDTKFVSKLCAIKHST